MKYISLSHEYVNMLIMKNTLTFLFLIVLSLSLRAEKLNYTLERKTPISGISFTGVSTICEDKNGFIWCGGETGVFFYDGMTFKHYSDSDNSGLPSVWIFDVINDSEGKLWFATKKGLAYFDSDHDAFISVDSFYGKFVEQISEASNGDFIVLADAKLYRYSYESKEAILFGNQPEGISTFSLSNDGKIYAGTKQGEICVLTYSETESYKCIFDDINDRVNTICIDNDWLYLGYNNSGVKVINSEGEEIKTYSVSEKNESFVLPDNKVRTIVKRDNGEIWVGTYSGLAVISSGDVSIFTNVNSALPSSSIYDIFIDSKSAVWIGTWSGGIAKYTPYGSHFLGESYYLTSESKFGVVTSFAPSVYKQCVCIGTENNGLYIYNYAISEVMKRYNSPVHIKAMLRYKDKILLGTLEGVFYFDEITGAIEELEIEAFRNIDPIVSSMVIKDGILYVGTREYGVLEYNMITKEEKVYNTSNNRLSSNSVWQIYVDGQYNVYLCTNEGFFLRKSTSDSFTNVSGSQITFFSIAEKEHNELVLGTRNNGIYIYSIDSGDIKPYDADYDFGGYDIYSIIPLENQLWLSTNNGLLCIDSLDGMLYRYSETDGVDASQFHPLASLFLSDGTCFWGSTIGFNYINTLKRSKNSYQPQVFPVEIFVNNKSLIQYDEIKTDKKHIPDIREIEMPYSLNNLSFRVLGNNLLNSDKNILKYRLEGYQKEWATVSQTENIVFTQVPPGKYTLCVYGANNDMVWGDKELRIRIFIHPPFYATGYAYFIYLVLIAIVVYFIYRNIRFRIHALQEITSERNQSRINKTIAEERTKFFMNISHELRTPLNLIVAPMKILREKHFDKETMFHLDVIYRNTERLRHLTDQILDFRLLEMDKIKANKKNVDLVPLCKDIISEFDYLVQKKNVNLKFSSDSLVRYINCDVRMIEKVIYNLLSNALKYTDDNPDISLEMKKTRLSDESYRGVFYVGNRFEGLALQISVSDNGNGIDKDKFDAVFERFNTYHGENQEGSGIGLHLCKEYVALHDGNIMLSSEVGKGSTFIVCLPMSADIEEQDVTAPILISQKKSETNENEVMVNNDEESYETNRNLKTVLIIDDNDEVVFYLKKSLSARYRCLVARNGKAGLDLALNIVPDIIVMDYMMPVMDGAECTRAIRENSKTRNIPVIVLSGAADTESQRKIINAGADIFLTKPVDEELLMEHISKLLLKAAKMNDIIYDPVPQSFTDKLDYFISKNIKDADFDVEALAACMHLSRSSLFRKIKTETGYNISEYLKEKRLEMAVELIKTGQTNVEELSMSCGFNSSSYFCKCFKAKYGVPPKEYMKNMN